MTGTGKEIAENMSKEEKRDVSNRIKAREIVQSIMEYGVSQQQIVYIIKLLSLELDDIHVMQKINEFLADSILLDTENPIDEKDVIKRPKKPKIYT
jgi:hypothetical protein